MKKVALVALFAVTLMGVVFAQGALNVNMPAAEKAKAINPQGVTIDQPRYGAVIWNNDAVSAWWSGVDVGYLNLDWGQLTDANTLPDEEIDGFKFKYGTNNMDPAGESIAVYYFDAATGWGNLGLQQAGFGFGGLPNGSALPTLPPGYGWIWSITVDLAGSGYDFILNDDNNFGVALSKLTPSLQGGTGMVIGLPGGFGGNGFTGTEDAFDVYYPNGTYNGTWYFGGYPNWATWSGQLMGSGVAANMAYYGIGAQGNNGHLYASGSFSASAGSHFMFALHGAPSAGVIVASTGASSQFIPSYGCTKLVGNFAPGFPSPMSMAFIGDFSTYDITPPGSYVGVTAYFQAAILAGSNTYASNGVSGTIAP